MTAHPKEKKKNCKNRHSKKSEKNVQHLIFTLEIVPEQILHDKWILDIGNGHC